MRVKLLGFEIDNYSLEEAVLKAEEYLLSGKIAQVVTINPEMFECAQSDQYFASIINESEIIIPDGVGVKIALKLNGINANRIPGIDFAKKMLEISAQKGCKVAIIGAKEDVITAAIKNLKNELNDLNIVYYRNGYFTEDEVVYSELSNAAPDLILAAMGSPRQEKFIYGLKKVLNKGVMIGIGGSLDVWSGMVKRAPLLFQRTGTEWLYRTVTQPSRFKRIFPTLPLFLIKVLKYKYVKK